jgi:hypothetical protein
MLSIVTGFGPTVASLVVIQSGVVSIVAFRISGSDILFS